MGKAIEELEKLVPGMDLRKLWEEVKANRARLENCAGHDFLPVENWRENISLIKTKVTCLKCQGTMDAGEVLTYLKGFAHGSGENYQALAEMVFPGRTKRDPA